MQQAATDYRPAPDVTPTRNAKPAAHVKLKKQRSADGDIAYHERRYHEMTRGF